MANIKISNLSNAGALNGTEVLPIVQGNATVKTTTQNIANLLGINYTPENVANKDTDATLSANSDTKYPSQKAVKTYVDSTVVSAITDNGNWDASGNLFPSVNAQGQPIAKGDLWYISVAGTLGGNAVLPGYSIRALVNTPGQNASSWGIINVGYGFTPENVANKSTDGTLSANSDTLYPSQKAIKTYVDNKPVTVGTLQQVTTAGATTTSNITANQYSTAVGSSLLSTGRLVAKDIVLQPTIGSSTNQVTLDASSITGNKSYTLPNATGTIALLSSISATSPLSYNSGTGVLSLSSANLISLSNLSYSSSSFVKMTASGTFSLDTNTYASSSALSNYLPLSGGNMIGAITSSATISTSANISANTSIECVNGNITAGLNLIAGASFSIGWNTSLAFLESNGSICLSGDSSNPDSSAILDIQSTTKGFLPPRMTYAERTAISSPAQGLMVYQNDNTIGVYVYDGSNWRRLNWT